MTQNLPATAPRDDRAHLGPAMRELNDRQQAFVHAVIQTGCSKTRAAGLAGYTGNAATLKAQGWKLAHDGRVQEAMREEASKLIRTHAVAAIGVIAEIASDPLADRRDRLRAATEILNRSGLSAQSEHRVVVEHTTDEAAQVKRIISMARQLGVDPRPMLTSAGVAQDVIDAEFTDVTDTIEDKEPLDASRYT